MSLLDAGTGPTACRMRSVPYLAGLPIGRTGGY
jgi:hypothetical protein